jgi:hypothetical protein
MYLLLVEPVQQRATGLKRNGFFCFPQHPHSASCSVGATVSFLEVERLELEADRSTPSNVEVKIGEAIPPLHLRHHGLVTTYLSIGITLQSAFIYS